MDIKKIFDNNEEWIKEKTAIDKNYFKDLAKGQSPGMLFIGCSDSRVPPEQLMKLGPGDVFVQRNVANVVANTDVNSGSVINYAVEHLKVQHVVICGHYGCGGVEAAMGNKDLGIINPWLREVRDVYRTYNKDLTNEKDDTARYRLLVELNVKEQCINLLKNPDIQKAMRVRANGKKSLQIHGWVFDIETGRLVDLNLDIPSLWDALEPIYEVDN